MEHNLISGRTAVPLLTTAAGASRPYNTTQYVQYNTAIPKIYNTTGTVSLVHKRFV